jgi:hypothetical protein
MAATFARSDFLACRFNGTHRKEWASKASPSPPQTHAAFVRLRSRARLSYGRRNLANVSLFGSASRSWVHADFSTAVPPQPKATFGVVNTIGGIADMAGLAAGSTRSRLTQLRHEQNILLRRTGQQ